jgi:uncharacterized protein YdaU (DUF1376 family)
VGGGLMHYYPFHLKDYLVETAHLPAMADLAYRRLLDLYYKTEEPIRNEPKWVANRIRMDGEERLIGFVLREYFRLDKDQDPPVWRHKTCDEVIAKYQKKAAVARANGEKHVAGSKKEPKSDADRKLTKNHKPRTNKSPLPPEGVALFDSFWSRYPKKQNKPKAVEAFAKALGYWPADAKPRCTFDELMAGLTVHLGCEQWVKDRGVYVPMASSWLNADDWNNRPVQHEGSKDGGAVGWWETRKGIMEQAVQRQVPAPADDSPQAFIRFKANVWVASGDGPWWDPKDTCYALAMRLRAGTGGE